MQRGEFPARFRYAGVMYPSFRLGALAAMTAALSMTAWAQASRTVNGHWQGALKNQGQDLTVVLDLTKNQKGEWIGTFGIPDVGIADLPVSGLAVGPADVRFTVTGFPGTPSYEGKIAADGNAINGTFTADKKPAALAFKRTGEAKVNLPPANSKLSKTMEGAWQSTLDGGLTTKYHIVLKLGRAADGTATGTLTSVDRGNLESALTSIQQTGNTLRFEIRSLNGSYRGELNATGTEIKGEWKQAANVTPMVFRRGASATAANSALTKAFEGTWHGLLDQGKDFKIELVLKLSQAADGSATGTLANTDAKSRELPVSAIIQKGTSLQFEVGLLKASFEGTLTGSTITGKWSQEGLLDNIPLTFKRQATAAK